MQFGYRSQAAVTAAPTMPHLWPCVPTCFLLHSSQPTLGLETLNLISFTQPWMSPPSQAAADRWLLPSVSGDNMEAISSAFTCLSIFIRHWGRSDRLDMGNLTFHLNGKKIKKFVLAIWLSSFGSFGQVTVIYYQRYWYLSDLRLYFLVMLLPRSHFLYWVFS